MAVKCTNCGGAHPSWDCGKPKREGRGILAIDPFEDVKPEPTRPEAIIPPKPKMGRPRTGYIKAEYNRQYSADLRTIKRLGLNCTVKEWREKNGNLQD